MIRGIVRHGTVYAVAEHVAVCVVTITGERIDRARAGYLIRCGADRDASSSYRTSRGLLVEQISVTVVTEGKSPLRVTACSCASSGESGREAAEFVVGVCGATTGGGCACDVVDALNLAVISGDARRTVRSIVSV